MVEVFSSDEFLKLKFGTQIESKRDPLSLTSMGIMLQHVLVGTFFWGKKLSIPH